MEKNVTVLGSDGEMIGVTYPKRAQGLVKKGRARYLDGDETVIVLASSPVDTTSQEDDMNNNFNFDEFIEKAKATAKVAGEEISVIADKSAEKLNEVFGKLNAALHDYSAKMDEASKSVDNTESEVEEETAEDSAPFEEVIEGVLDDINDEEVRAKIRAEVEREKARRQRAKEREQRVEDAKRRMREVASEASKKVAVAARDAAAWTKQAIKDAEAKIAEAKEKAKEAELVCKEKVAEAKERVAEAKAVAEEPAPELSIESVLREIRKIEHDSEYIRHAIDSVSAIELGAPGDIGAQAKAMTINNIFQEREITNRELLERHYAILAKLMQEDEEKKATEARNREIAYREAEQSEKDAAKLSILEGLLENILEADETTGVNKLSFYMKTAEKMVRENPSLLTDEIIAGMLEAIEELDEAKAEDQNKLAFFMKLMG